MKTYLPYALRVIGYGMAAAIPLWINDSSWKDIVGYGLLAALAYAGIGGASTRLEPAVGRKPG